MYLIFFVVATAALLAYLYDVKRKHQFTKTRHEWMRETLGDYVSPRYDQHLTDAYKAMYRQTKG